MHIGFRTSGGRGEYEVVGSHSGYTAASLEGWSFYMRWPDGIVRDTGLWLDPAGSGKPRLRSLLKPEIQIGRIISSMLLLPDPRRDVRTTPVAWPIVQEKQYSVTQVGFGQDSEYAEMADQVTFTPSWIEVANQESTDAIGVAARWRRIAAVYERAAELPEGLQSLLLQHHDYLAGAQIVEGGLPKIVKALCKDLAATAAAIYLEGYATGSDPLPLLEALVDLSPDIEPSLPPPDELSEDEPEISIRSAHQYRLQKVRGPAGKVFSDKVRAAYGHRCAFCGAQFSGVDGVLSGIDAAHILAWSQHDLDVVTNGMALCKLHHWAFDAGLLLIRKFGENYFTYFTTLAERLDAPSAAALGTHGRQIPDDRLPVDTSMRPSKQYLDLAYADLGVEFSSAPWPSSNV